MHGLGPVASATVFPHNIGLGATRDAALVEEIARITADESAGVGADFPFAPVIAVARDERWGRTYEAFGETTDLASRMGVAMVKGLQFPTGGTRILDPRQPQALPGRRRHRGRRDRRSGHRQRGGAARASPRALSRRDRARAGSMMLSYNTWQGTEMHVNKAMVTDVLKGQLGFGGFVVTDYNGCFQAGVSGSASLAACLNAGADMFMIFGGNTGAPQRSGTLLSDIRELVESDTVPQSRLDDAVRRILAVKCEMGLFDTTGVIDRR